MNQRQEKLLYDIIQEFYQTAQPVGSSLLVSKYYANLSSATIRNEMATLEKDEYIVQPHTSAGRIPTEKGYRYYLDNLLESNNLNKNKQKSINDVVKEDFQVSDVKNLAKVVAEMSQETVFVAFNKNDFYYTGISNLLAKPEFYQRDLVLNVSKVIDHFDEVLSEIFNQLNDGVNILIGKENPFSPNCATVVLNYDSGNNRQLFGILGATRMDYAENKAILQYCQSIINKI